MPKSLTENENLKDILVLQEQKTVLEKQIDSFKKNITALKAEEVDVTNSVAILKKEEKKVSEKIADQKSKIIPESEILDGLVKLSKIKTDINEVELILEDKTKESTNLVQKIENLTKEYETRGIALKDKHELAQKKFLMEEKEDEKRINALKLILNGLNQEIFTKNKEKEFAIADWEKAMTKKPEIEQMKSTEERLDGAIKNKEKEFDKIKKEIEKEKEKLDAVKEEIKAKEDETLERIGAIAFRERLYEEKKVLLWNFVEFLMKKYEDPSLKIHFDKFISQEPKQLQ